MLSAPDADDDDEIVLSGRSIRVAPPPTIPTPTSEGQGAGDAAIDADMAMADPSPPTSPAGAQPQPALPAVSPAHPVQGAHSVFEAVVLEGVHPMPPPAQPRPTNELISVRTNHHAGGAPPVEVVAPSALECWNVQDCLERPALTRRALRRVGLPTFQQFILALIAPHHAQSSGASDRVYTDLECLIGEVAGAVGHAFHIPILSGHLEYGINLMLRETKTMPEGTRFLEAHPLTRFSLIARILGYRMRAIAGKEARAFKAEIERSFVPIGRDVWLNSYWMLDDMYLLRRRAEYMPEHAARARSNSSGQARTLKALLREPVEGKITPIGGPGDSNAPWITTNLARHDPRAECHRLKSRVNDEIMDVVCADADSWHNWMRRMRQEGRGDNEALLLAALEAKYPNALLALEDPSLITIFSVPKPYSSAITQAPLKPYGQKKTRTRQVIKPKAKKAIAQQPQTSPSASSSPAEPAVLTPAKSIEPVDLSLVLAQTADCIEATLAPLLAPDSLSDCYISDVIDKSSHTRSPCHTTPSEHGPLPEVSGTANRDGFVETVSQKLEALSTRPTNREDGDHCGSDTDDDHLRFGMNEARKLAASVCRHRPGNVTESAVKADGDHGGYQCVSPDAITPMTGMSRMAELEGGEFRSIPVWMQSGRWKSKPGRRPNRLLAMEEQGAVLHVYPSGPRTNMAFLVSPTIPRFRTNEVRQGIVLPGQRRARTTMLLPHSATLLSAKEISNMPHRLDNLPRERPIAVRRPLKSSASASSHSRHGKVVEVFSDEDDDLVEDEGSDYMATKKAPNRDARSRKSLKRSTRPNAIRPTYILPTRSLSEDEDMLMVTEAEYAAEMASEPVDYGDEEMAHGLRRVRRRPGQFLALLNTPSLFVQPDEREKLRDGRGRRPLSRVSR